MCETEAPKTNEKQTSAKMENLLLIAITLVPILAVARQWRVEGSWHFLNPVNMFWLTFVYAGVAQPLLSDDEWIPFYGGDVFLLTLAMFLLLGIAFAIGYALPYGPRFSRVLPDFSRPSDFKIFFAGAALIGLGLLGYFLIMRASGGAAYWLSGPRYNTNFENLSGYTYTLPRLATLGIMVLLCHAFTLREAYIYKFCIVALALMNTIWQAYTGTREGTIMMLVILYGSIFAALRRNPPLLATAVLLPTVVFIFGFIPTYRGDFRDLSFNLTDRPGEVVDRSFGFFSDPDFGSQAPSTYKPEKGPDLWSDFGMAISVVYYVPDRVTYNGGSMLLEVLTHGIPRALWPGKIYPESIAWDKFHRVSNISTSENFEGLRGGPSPTMVGKYYYIGGPLGIILGGLFSGFCFRLLWEFLRRQLRYVTGVILLVASSGLGGMEMIHPLAWSVFFWVPTVFVPFLCFVWLARDNNAPPDATSDEMPNAMQPRRVTDENGSVPATVVIPLRRAAPAPNFDKRLPNRKSIRRSES